MREYILNKIKVGDLSRGDSKAPFSIATTFLGLLHFTLNLSVKQSGIKYHFLSL